METKTPTQLFQELGEEFTQLTMESNQKLIIAIEEERFEDAAKHRDFIQMVIDNTVQLSLILLDLDEQTIRESFTRQNNIVYNALVEEYHNPTEIDDDL